ncbi:MAG: hypothetical protein AB7S38_17145 [Vulcanimicrobiota bacterium]
MKTHHAAWYKPEYDSTWDRVKAAFANDWEQTKNDFGSKFARDLDQDVDDTIKQMAGKQSTVRFGEREFDDMEPAFRYGHAARRHYNKDYPTWNTELHNKLKADYQGDWDRDWPLVHHAYGYRYKG